MAVASLATVVITPLVEFWMAAAWVVLSPLSSSTPVSSMNAPRVPEPSSRETTVMAWVASKSPAAASSAGASSSAASLLSAGAASLLEAAVLSEAAVDSEVAVLPQAARLRAMAAAQTRAILRFMFRLLPYDSFVQVMPAAVP